jgi:altronate dehydratase large subunit
MSLTGYKRSNGEWGFRNHVLIAPLHQMLSQSARAIEEAVPGVVAISHDWSGMREKDFDRIAKTLSGILVNPNVFHTVILSIGTDIESEILSLAQAHAKTLFTIVTLKDAGSLQALTELASTAAATALVGAKALKREAAPWSAVVLGLECGGSDAYSGITANPALGVASDKFVADGATSILGETM